MFDALLWFLGIQVLGLIALPLSFFLFQRLPDHGYSLTKPLALALFAYILWVLGLTRLIPNSLPTILVILALGGAISLWLGFRQRAAINAFFRRQWPALLAAETVFLALFVLWTALISGFPAINHTEKPMDFGFLNAVLNSRYFPPEDPWLAGQPISYYYFGHFMAAFVTKLTTIPSSVGYNLGVALIPALAGAASFGLLYNLVRLSGGRQKTALAFGLIAPVLLLLIGNLEGALEFVYAQGWGSPGFWQWVGIKGLEGGGAASATVFPEQTWWWWRATRVIDTLQAGQSLDYTITEFPAFSFILGDLHPHVTALPFMLLALSLGLNFYQSGDKMGLSWLARHPLESLALAFFLGALAFINIWDFPVFAALLGLIALTKGYGQESSPAGRTPGLVLWRTLANTLAMLAPVYLLAVVLFLPFYLELSSQASGILPVTGPGTRPFLFFLVMGLFALLGVSFLLRQILHLPGAEGQDAPAVAAVASITLAPILLWAIIVLPLTWVTDGAGEAITKVAGRVLWTLPGMLVAGLAWHSAAQRVRRGRGTVAAFPLLLLGASFYLLVGAELFFLVDLFGSRMNTVFKVYFQSWLLLSVVGAYGLYYWHAHRPAASVKLRLGHYAWAGAVAALVLVSLYYPVGAVLDRTGYMDDSGSVRDNTIDGLAFLRRHDPAEYAAIRWLQEEAPWGRLVEAVGDDYTDYGRISSSTGLPTILGWKGHELQWRGTYEAFAGREEDVALIYQSQEPDVVRRILEKYDIRYVYIGPRERRTYGDIHEEKFSGFMRTAFQQDGVVIYERIKGLEERVKSDSDPG